MFDSTQTEQMDAVSCIDAYAHDYMTARTDVCLLTDRNIDRVNSAFTQDYSGDEATFHSTHSSFSWICDDESKICDVESMKSKAAIGNWGVEAVHVVRCGSRKVEERCTFRFDLLIGIVVVS